jgi:outer membrane PBP1 activator LpoA protein
MSRYYFALPYMLIVFLSGCQTMTGGGAFQSSVAPWVIEQNDLRLRSIESSLQSGNSAAAKQQADTINLPELTEAQLAQYNLQYAQIFLNFGEAEQAIKRLATTQTQLLSLPDQVKYYHSLAFAQSLTGNLFESAKARIALDVYLTDPIKRKKNQAVILETLALVPDVAGQIKQNNQPPGVPEWLSLAKILAHKNRNPAEFNTSLANWRSANAQHPANIYLATVQNLPVETSPAHKMIAVFLPESGPFSDAGKAIKAGFLAAHSKDNPSGGKPKVQFYDSGSSKIGDLYQQAVREGASLIVGPLNKEDVQALTNSISSFTTPVLALNHVPGLTRQNLYQYALSPLDDVAEITKKAAVDGKKNAVLLLPNSDQGKRLMPYFYDNWQKIGGVFSGKKSYDPKANDFTATLSDLFQPTANSQKTNPAISQQSPQPALTQGIDTLFLSAYNKEGRLINSQVKNLQNSLIGVYALPNIYSGIPDPTNDNALNDVIFCDAPWFFDTAYSGDLSMMSLRNIWNQFPNPYLRLVAMGIDAYHLTDKLTSLNIAPLLGATGKLTLESDNRIKRSLICAKFTMGLPVLLGYTHGVNDNESVRINNGTIQINLPATQ